MTDKKEARRLELLNFLDKYFRENQEELLELLNFLDDLDSSWRKEPVEFLEALLVLAKGLEIK